MNDFDLIDLNTYVKLRQAAPLVTVVPADIARDLILALVGFSELNLAFKDANGRIYWQASLKKINEYWPIKPHPVPLMTLGRACREMGLEMVRKSSGYHAAWSQEQLDILKSYFDQKVTHE